MMWDKRGLRPAIVTLKGKKNLIGCEVGVAGAPHVVSVFQLLDIKTIYLIDQYLYPSRTPYYKSAEIALTAKRNSHRVLEPYDSKVIWIYKPSVEAALYIPTATLDFVYIDGDHTYEGVLSDLKSYYPKVVKGGLVSGHDYASPGVSKAVGEFMEGFQVKLHTGNYPKEAADWWFIK